MSHIYVVQRTLVSSFRHSIVIFFISQDRLIKRLFKFNCEVRKKHLFARKVFLLKRKTISKNCTGQVLKTSLLPGMSLTFLPRNTLLFKFFECTYYTPHKIYNFTNHVPQQSGLTLSAYLNMISYLIKVAWDIAFHFYVLWHTFCAQVPPSHWLIRLVCVTLVWHIQCSGY